MMAKVASLPRIASAAVASSDLAGSGQIGRADTELIDGLIDRVLDGDPDAWRAFAGRVHPVVLAILRRRRLGGDLSEREDLHRDVAMEALDRLHADGFAALRRYAGSRELYPETRFVQWLAVVVGNTFVDRLRSLPEYQRRRNNAARALVRIAHEPLDADAADRGPSDPASGAELRRILACFLADDFPAAQRRALLLWLDGNSPAEIAEELGLPGPQRASRLLHAARERLRRRFARV
jgi:RNA polymerase sigma factor (sigma-70 family)